MELKQYRGKLKLTAGRKTEEVGTPIMVVMRRALWASTGWSGDEGRPKDGKDNRAHNSRIPQPNGSPQQRLSTLVEPQG